MLDNMSYDELMDMSELFSNLGTLCFIIAALGAFVCFAVVPMWSNFRKKYSDNPEV